MQAVIQIGTTQYLVSPGQELLISRQNKEHKDLSISQVLALIDGDKVQLGTPFLKNAHVEAQVLDEVKGEKIRVATYKAKSRYRRVVGFRPKFTKIKIKGIETQKTVKSSS
jgi:large subunit ribosomal protein L21